MNLESIGCRSVHGGWREACVRLLEISSFVRTSAMQALDMCDVRLHPSYD